MSLTDRERVVLDAAIRQMRFDGDASGIHRAVEDIVTAHIERIFADQADTIDRLAVDPHVHISADGSSAPDSKRG